MTSLPDRQQAVTLIEEAQRRGLSITDGERVELIRDWEDLMY